MFLSNFLLYNVYRVYVIGFCFILGSCLVLCWWSNLDFGWNGIYEGKYSLLRYIEDIGKLF